MTTLQDARFKLDRQLLDRHAAGLPAHVEQIDCVLCEDNESVMAYVYLAGTSDVIIILFDLPMSAEMFDHRACSEQLLSCDGETVH